MDWKQKIFNIEFSTSHKVITILGIKIKRRLGEKIYVENLLKTQIVRDSGLFDAKYYIAKYHPDFDIATAVYYYTQKGYKFLEQPSEIFEVDRYKRKNNINPILDFVLCGRYNYTKVWWSNKFPADKKDINNYIEEKAKRVSKKVVYMCITNNFDSLEEISAHKYINPDWDYVCFTDNEEHIKQKRMGIWEIRPLFKTEKSPAKTNRWHKIHPHILFPEYEESIYIDANVNVLTDKLFMAIKAKNKNILFPQHANNVDLYKEIQWANEVAMIQMNAPTI